MTLQPFDGGPWQPSVSPERLVRLPSLLTLPPFNPFPRLGSFPALLSFHGCYTHPAGTPPLPPTINENSLLSLPSDQRERYTRSPCPPYTSYVRLVVPHAAFPLVTLRVRPPLPAPPPSPLCIAFRCPLINPPPLTKRCRRRPRSFFLSPTLCRDTPSLLAPPPFCATRPS